MGENVHARIPIGHRNQTQYMHLGNLTPADFKVQYEIGPFSSPVSILKFSPDGKHLASVHNGSNLSLWDIEKRDLRHSFNDRADITTMTWSRDSSIILTGNSRSQLSLWDRARGRVLTQVQSTMRDVTCSDLNSHMLAVAGSTDGTAKVYDIRNGVEINKYKFNAAVRSVSFSQQNYYFAASLDDGTAFIVDAVGKAYRAQLRPTSDLPLTAIKFCPNYRHLITTCISESRIRKFTILNSKWFQLRSDEENQSAIPTAHIYYHDKPWSIIDSGEVQLRSWKSPDASILQTWNQNSDPILNVDIHPTKEIIAAGVNEYNPSIMLWQNEN